MLAENTPQFTAIEWIVLGALCSVALVVTGTVLWFFIRRVVERLSRLERDSAQRPEWVPVENMATRITESAINKDKLAQYESGVLLAPMYRDLITRSIVREEIQNAN